jgi:hypothetical protein
LQEERCASPMPTSRKNLVTRSGRWQLTRPEEAVGRHTSKLRRHTAEKKPILED